MKAVCDFSNIPTLHAQGDSFGVPSLFLPIMGKAFVQHLFEYIERLGFDTIALYLSSYADEIEHFIGDGERWGVSISYQLVKKTVSVKDRLKNSNFLSPNEFFLYCTTENLPLITKDVLAEKPLTLLSNDSDHFDTGWRWGTVETLSDDNHNINIEIDTISIRNGEAYLQSLRKMLSHKGKNLIVFGKEIREGVWIGPGSKIPTACTLVPPVFISSQVSLGAGAIIGPNVELGKGSIVDSDSYVTNSSILTGSYIGKNLDVKKCIVNQNQILHVELSTVYTAADDILLSPIEFVDTVHKTSPTPILSRILALILGTLFSPIQLLIVIINKLILKQRIKKITVVPIPQKRDPSTFKAVKTQSIYILRSRYGAKGSICAHLIWHLIPEIWSIAAGRRRFFGLPLKTEEEFNRISKDWQGIYLRSTPGIISEADILYREYPDEDMLFATEMFYSVNDSPRYNFTLLLRYIKALFRGRIG
jgi:carbonic anhydrase/acetyltransferase-like protein (isoleucine patch superfamily)